jgi:hypothetical protein
VNGLKVVSLDACLSTSRVAENLIEPVPLHDMDGVGIVCDNPEAATSRKTTRMGNPEEVGSWRYVPDAAKVLGCEGYRVVSNGKDLRQVKDKNHIAAP